MFWKINSILARLAGSNRPHDTVAVVGTVYAPDGKHRVRYFRRDEDGVCGYLEEYYDDKLLEMAWRPVKAGGAREYPDLAAAKAAAKGEVPWLHLVEP